MTKPRRYRNIRIARDHNTPRAHSIRIRNDYTDTLKEHGVKDHGYMECTEGIYGGFFGCKSYELRRLRGLPPLTNIRDHLPEAELIFVAAAEALSAERIRDEMRTGNGECAAASYLSASTLRRAIEADRMARRLADG
jgi:hypothetical protein